MVVFAGRPSAVPVVWCRECPVTVVVCLLHCQCRPASEVHVLVVCVVGVCRLWGVVGKVCLCSLVQKSMLALVVLVWVGAGGCAACSLCVPICLQMGVLS